MGGVRPPPPAPTPPLEMLSCGAKLCPWAHISVLSGAFIRMEVGGGGIRLQEYAAWYLWVYVRVRLLRRGSSAHEAGVWLPTHGVGG